MIKINLLNSVTERQTGTVDAVDRKVSSAGSRFLLWRSSSASDWRPSSAGTSSAHRWRRPRPNSSSTSKSDRSRARGRDERAKRPRAKIDNIDARIDAIKKLRDSQAGPSAVLEAMKERDHDGPGTYLESVEQTGDSLSSRAIRPTSRRSHSLAAASSSLTGCSRTSVSRRSVPRCRTRTRRKGACTAASESGRRQGRDRELHDQVCLHAVKGGGANANPTTRFCPGPTAPASSRTVQVAKN